MSTLTSNYQFILPQVNNAIDENIWGDQLNTDWSNADGFILGANTGNIGNSAPTIPATAAPTGGMTWINNTANPWVINIYDGTNWVMTGSINTTDHIYSNVGNIAVNVQAFTTAGAFTYTPSVGMSYCIVEIVGGGGGAGYMNTPNPGIVATGGGGGGQYTRQIFTLAQIGASQPIVIGAGGAAGSPGVDAGNGGTSTFGVSATLLSVAGGHGSPTMTGIASGLQGAPGGAGGTSVGNLGFFSVPGTQGVNGMALGQGSISFGFGGAGGNSFFGGGGHGFTVVFGGTQGAGLISVAPGSGAGGGASIFATGGGGGTAGQAGAVIITEFI